MNTKKTNPPFLNGVPEMLILQLLDGRPMYGYELVQAILAASAEAPGIRRGVYLPHLAPLGAQQLLASRRQAVGGRDRVVYRMTPGGRKQLAATVLDWQRVVAAVNGCLQGGERVRASLA